LSKSLTFLDWWNPYAWLVVICLLIGYLLITGPLHKEFKGGEPVPTIQRFYFVLGLIVAGGALGSPLSTLGHHYLFSAHMLQQSLLYFVVPPLLWAGIPTWLFRSILPQAFRQKILPKITNAILAVFLFNGLLSFYHFPAIYDWIMSGEQPLAAVFAHTLLFLTAMQMWFVVTCPDPDLNQLSHLKKIGYVVLNGFLLYPACALIIFADNLIYKPFHAVQPWFPFLTPLGDQQLGGVIMKIMQEGVFGIALGILFSRWYRKERSDEQEE